VLLATGATILRCRRQLIDGESRITTGDFRSEVLRTPGAAPAWWQAALISSSSAWSSAFTGARCVAIWAARPRTTHSILRNNRASVDIPLWFRTRLIALQGKL
jgi:hypothetical protein